MVLGRKLPKDVIDSWPDVLGDINLHVLPMKYLNTILVNFKDGTTWEIKITNKIKNGDWSDLEQMLIDLHSNYDKSITNFDFKLDVFKIKKDIEKSTIKFLRKKKL